MCGFICGKIRWKDSIKSGTENRNERKALNAMLGKEKQQNGENKRNGEKKQDDGGILQIIKFALVGVSNTIVSEGVYAILIFCRMHYLPASFIGFSVSVLNAYYWSNKYVFKEQDGGEKRIWWKVLLKTYIAYLWGYLASAALLVFWIDVLHIGRWMEPLGNWFLRAGYARFDAQFLGNLAAAGLNLLITVPMNFVLNKYWAYRQKDSAPAEKSIHSES